MARLIHCDCCYVSVRDEEVWTYEIQPFMLPAEGGMREYEDDGQWAICNDCHAAIQQNDWEALLGRSMASDPLVGKVPAMKRWKERILNAFRYAERVRPPYQGPPPPLVFDGQHR